MSDATDTVQTGVDVVDNIMTVNDFRKAVQSNNSFENACKDFLLNPSQANADIVREEYFNAIGDSADAIGNISGIWSNADLGSIAKSLGSLNRVDAFDRLENALSNLDRAKGTDKYSHYAERQMCFPFQDILKDALEEAAERIIPPRPRSPLVFDLDHDGIETLGQEFVYFDHNGDGIANLTGWVSGDDGFLVFDKDGNGLIETGNELFGDNYLKEDGSTASNGFDALSDLDSNQDGIFDINDNAFTQLKVWQDINQDGVSQDSELFTLDQAGVASVNLSATATNIDAGDGNTITFDSTYTNIQGETHQIVDVVFNESQYHTVFTNEVILTEDILTLPELTGMGMLDSLHRTMAQHPELQTLVESFIAAQTAGEQRTVFASILETWASYSLLNENYLPVTWLSSTSVWAVNPQTGELELSGTVTTHHLSEEASKKIHILNLVSGNAQDLTNLSVDGAYIGMVEARILDSYDTLFESMYEILASKIRLSEYLDKVEIIFEEGGIRYDYSQFTTYLDEKIALTENPLTLIEDLVVLAKVEPELFYNQSFNILSVS